MFEISQKTIHPDEYILKRFTEKKTRGHTLNQILKNFGKKSDLLIIADDIKLTPGWFEKLTRNKKMLIFGDLA